MGEEGSTDYRRQREGSRRLNTDFQCRQVEDIPTDKMNDLLEMTRNSNVHFMFISRFNSHLTFQHLDTNRPLVTYTKFC